MKRLFIISAVLQLTNPPPNQITTKLIQSYRFTETQEEALGSVVLMNTEKFPDFHMQSHLVLEIPPNEVAAVYKEQANDPGTA